MLDGTSKDNFASELVADVLNEKPRLLIEPNDPDVTVEKLRDVLAAAGPFFDRGGPVRLARDQAQGGIVAQPVTPSLVVLETHRACRPYMVKTKDDGTWVEIDARLSVALASMYLDWRGEWRLKPLNGIALAPLLHADGTIHSKIGFDEVSGMWCENVPDLAGIIPEHPTKVDAEQALLVLRRTFATFCFADAHTVADPVLGVPVVDLTKPPGNDESGFLAALLTAVCRPSLHLAPGFLVRAAPMSGAGAGKGLLVRCICIIAFGREPHAVTSGSTRDELEKRIAAELIEGSPALFVDNLNNVAFKSDLLASAITERPARVRILGESRMVALYASVFIALTGNGITSSEDMTRRLLVTELDPGTEDPEARPFKGDIRAEVKARRRELLAACLTIWRYGRQATDIKSGRPLGSFGQWCAWVRDPLLALGCKDPAERVSDAKARDSRRQEVADIFSTWWRRHHDLPVACKDLHDEIRRLVDPQNRGRQFIAAALEKLVGTRMSGFVLTRQAPPGKWGAATFALKDLKAAKSNRSEAREGAADAPYAPDGAATASTSETHSSDPMPPIPPMPSDLSDEFMDDEVLV